MHIWHRRAGKDSFCLNLIAIEAIKNPGTYWIVYPEMNHARTALWRNVSNGVRTIDQAFPPEIRKTIRDAEMVVELKNGSIIKFLSADEDKLVGAEVNGVVFSEWALCEDDAAFKFIMPILARNKGWAIFITTFRGKNHAWKLYQELKDDPEWFVTLRTVKDTGIVGEKELEAARVRMGDVTFNQEFMCDPLAAFEGAYYQTLVKKLYEEKRAGNYGYDSSLPVHIAFDIGWSDQTVGISFQVDGNQTNIIGCLDWRFTTIADICRDVRRKLPWGTEIDSLILPHDASLGADLGATRAQQYQEGIRPTELIVLPRANVQSGIDKVKALFPTLCVDTVPRAWTEGEPNNLLLMEALAGYRTEKKEGGVYSKNPSHTWESHYADALRYVAESMERLDVGQPVKFNYAQLDRAQQVLRRR